MATLTHIETDTGTNVDISSATAIGSYTSTGDKLVMVDVSIDAVAGNGDYVMYVKRQINGAGSSYIILPKTTMAAASGETAISGQSGWITVRNGDVLTVYVDGLAGDTSTPDYTTRWFELAVQLVTLADDAITASKFDESTAFPLKSADTGSTTIARVGADSDTLETLSDQMDAIKSDTADILADTGTDGVLISSGTGAKQISLASGAVLLQPTQTGVTIPTVTNLTNLPTMPTDWITAAGVKADAVTKIQSGLATAIELTNVQNLIKYPPILVSGAGTLAANGKYYFDSMLNGYPKYKHDFPLPNIFIYFDADAWHIAYQQLDDYYSCSDYANTPDATIAAWEKGPQGSDPIPTVSAYLDPDDPTLGAIMEAIEDISTGSGATPQQIWEYVSRTLTDASGLGLATDTALSVTDGKVDAIKAKTDNLPANPAPANEYDAELAALQSSVNAIAPLDEVLIDTGTQQFTTADLIKIVAARMVGKASGGGTGTITYRNIEDTLDIVVMIVDEFGNRSEVELA